MAKYSVKPEFVGKEVVVGGKKILLLNLSDELADQIVAAGLGSYFEGEPEASDKDPQPVKLTVIKEGAMAKKAAEGDLEAAAKAAAKAAKEAAKAAAKAANEAENAGATK